MSDRVRVVVAEDEALIRLDIVEMLKDAGYDVVAAVGNGKAAVDAVERLKPDVVLMDVKMPIMDGLSAAEHIGDDVAVVILSAFSQTEPRISRPPSKWVWPGGLKSRHFARNWVTRRRNWKHAKWWSAPKVG